MPISTNVYERKKNLINFPMLRNMKNCLNYANTCERERRKKTKIINRRI